MQKYDFDEARPILERASARETAARVALGRVASQLPRAGGRRPDRLPRGRARRRPRARRARGPSRTTWPGSTTTRSAASTPTPRKRWSAGSTRRTRTATPSAASSRWSCTGCRPGLGSHVHWDRRLDSRLAGALMGIQAIKGVEVGDGFALAATPGSLAHDEIVADRRRASAGRRGRSGGTEGGMTTGEVLRVRAAMKPIATVPAGAAHRRRRHRRGGGRPPPALRRLRGARPPASSPRRWSRWCWPTRCWRSSAATRSPRPGATPRATSTR